MYMEPISEVLGDLVAELIEKERGAERPIRAMGLEEAAAQAALPGFDARPIFSEFWI